MKALKVSVAFIVTLVAFILWSEHCFNRGAAAAEQQCEWDAEYDPERHVDA